MQSAVACFVRAKAQLNNFFLQLSLLLGADNKKLEGQKMGASGQNRRASGQIRKASGQIRRAYGQ